MSFGALVLLLFAGLLLLVATFFFLGVVFHDKEPKPLHLSFAAGVLTVVALIALGVAHWLGVGIDQEAFAKKIAEQIRSAPLKVEISGNGVKAAIDEKTLANAIVDRLRTAPLDVQVTKEPPFDNDALARAIAEQLSLHRPPSVAADGLLSALIYSKNIFTTFGVIALLLMLVLAVIWFLTKKPWFGDMAILTGIGGILATTIGILTAHYWPPPTDSAQIVVSFDNSGRNAEQVFFDASSDQPIRFSSSDDTPPREAVCAAMAALNKRGSKVAILVGSHDQLPLRWDAELRFSSNAGLARQRAQAVRNILVEKNKPVCNSSSIETVITLSNAPLNVGAKHRGNEQLKEDRTVRIYGLAVR